MNKPDRSGYYWGIWIKADPDTTPGAWNPNDRWEVFEVNRHDHPDGFFEIHVFVPGENMAQSLDNFIWGSGPLTPPASLGQPDASLSRIETLLVWIAAALEQKPESTLEAHVIQRIEEQMMGDMWNPVQKGLSPPASIWRVVQDAVREAGGRIVR